MWRKSIASSRGLACGPEGLARIHRAEYRDAMSTKHPSRAGWRSRLAAVPALPVWLLATMLGIGLVLEVAFYGRPQWAVKLPLAILVTWLAVRPARRGS